MVGYRLLDSYEYIEACNMGSPTEQQKIVFMTAFPSSCFQLIHIYLIGARLSKTHESGKGKEADIY
jgi:hypothetical protein